MSFYIHRLSKLSASGFLNHIKNTKKVPADYKRGFSHKGKAIIASAAVSLSLPRGAKPGSTVKLARWYELICFASMKPDKTNPNNDWYITTGVVVGEKRFLHGKKHGGLGEKIALTADLGPGQLIKLQKQTPQKPSVKSSAKPPSAQPRNLGMIKPKSGAVSKLPKTIKKSLGKVSPLITSTFAGQDALGLCLPNNKWQGVAQAGAGHSGNGGLLIVANRVDKTSFKSKREAALNQRIVASNIGETLIHEMIHAGRYASGMQNWVGHTKKDFGPFL